ncbi:MAG TPA: DUF58 domain-containing protein [Woeseiaceae bacterium]|nr:DUF58 domain-containing protein [Woeseiaceae bacterium]
MTPGIRLISLVGLLALAGIGVAFFPASALAWKIAAGLVVLIACFDIVFLLGTKAPRLQRRAPASMALATWTDIGLELQGNPQSRRMRVRVFDHHPQSFLAPDLPLDCIIEPGEVADLEYQGRATERGPQQFAGCEIRIASPFGLWWRQRFIDIQSTAHVYPNYSTISNLLAYAVDPQSQITGVRLSRRRGEGIEFHQLRDYREGDSLRSVDWKATARMGRLIAREYQDERDQQVVFLLDAGRRMLAKDDELAHFDHALNAMLLLSYVAIRQGDSAGVMTAGSERTWLPPRKGADAINGLLNHVYDIQPKPIEIDYIAAATELTLKQRRRSLIIILSNAREEDSEELRIATNLLRRRHLVILASLRESALDEALAHDVHSFDDAVLYAATNQYLDARRESHKLLQAGGVFVEDCLCAELPAAITNRYLAIKRAGLL